MRVQASVKRSRSPPRIGKQDASFALEVCVCVCFLAQQTPTRRRRAEREERESVCVCECVFVSSLPGGNLRCSSCQNDTILRPHTHTHTHSMNTHTHTSSTCGEYYSSFITFSHSIPPSLPPSFARSLLQFNL